METIIKELHKKSYNKWLNELRYLYNFANSYIETLEIDIVEKTEKLIKIDNEEEKEELVKQLKLIKITYKYFVLFCDLCDDDDSYEKIYFKTKPFKLMKIIHKTLNIVLKRHNRPYSELSMEQKTLIYQEDIQFKKRNKSNKKISSQIKKKHK